MATLRGVMGGSYTFPLQSHYSHGGHGWNLKLRDAVTELETTYSKPVLSYDGSATVRPDLKKIANFAEDHKKGWWSQRDLNPCLSFERAKEDEKKQQDDSSGASNE